MASINPLSGAQSQQSPLETLLAAYRAQQERPLQALRQRQQLLQSQRNLLSSLRNTLQELLARAVDVAQRGTNPFAARKVESSSPDIATASADSSAILSSATLFVERLARADVLASNRLSRTDPFGITGTRSFQLTANGTTVTVSVTFDGSETTEQALRRIAAAINSTANVGATATVVQDTPSTVRLTLIAKQTGSPAAITFDDPEGLLATLGWTPALFADPANRTVMTDSSAGYQLSAVEQLNAQVVLNGISLVRPTNTFDDALPGVRLTLLRAQRSGDPPVTLTTTVDTDKVANYITTLLNAYNDALKALNSALSKEFKGDGRTRALLLQLRAIVSEQLGSGSLRSLSDIGITIGKDGTLTLSAKDRLQQQLQNDPSQVARLLGANGGFADRLRTLLEEMTASNGGLRARMRMTDERIRNLSTRIRQLQQRIDQQVEAYRREYLKLQQLYSMAQSQLGLLGNFASPSSGIPLVSP